MPVVRPIIPLLDYQRIFRVIKTALDGADANTHASSIFFSIVGATILRQVYKKQCFVMAGAAYYLMDDHEEQNRPLFGTINGEELSSSMNAFHCWIVCENQIIDFMAPVFRESIQSAGVKSNCPRKMFQKHIELMSPYYDLLNNSGDFYLEPNIDLTETVINNFNKRVTNTDLTNVCLHWYKKPPKKIDGSLTMASSDGSLITMNLSPLELIGAW